MCDKFALLLVEIDSGKSRELVADEYKVMGLDGSKINEAPPFKWKDNSTIQLGIWNPSKIWLVDINTGNITYSEKTPNP
jgi:hypothetical protein